MIKIEDKEIGEVMYKSSPIDRIYLGENKVFQAITGSYMVLTNRRKIYFNPSNVNSDNFGVAINVPEITVSGEKFSKTDIAEIYFRDEFPDMNLSSSFLSQFKGLNKLDLSGFNNIAYIFQDCFMEINIKELDLSAFSNVYYIGSNFLANANTLFVDMSSMTQLKTMNPYFGYKSHIQQIILPQAEIKTIPSSFLTDTPDLKSIDFSVWNNIQTIENRFMENSAIIELDISNWTKLKGTLGSFFLFGCNNLVNLKLPKIDILERLDTGFLLNCKKIEKVDLSPIKRINVIGNSILDGCSSLKEINIGGIDFSAFSTLNSFRKVPNRPECVIYADTLELAQKFKDCIGNPVSNWTMKENPR